MAQLSLNRVTGHYIIVLLLGLGLSIGGTTASSSPLLFDGLGTFEFKVTTENPEARKYVNQGFVFLYAFNHDEAIRSFQQAATLDPRCAMAWWGIAHANGPHINYTMLPPHRAKAAWAALKKAQQNAGNASPVEKALIEALGHRFAETPADDRSPLDKAYAEAMKKAWQQFPDNADVGALYAESLMDLRPWDLWVDGKPRPGTPELVETLEQVLKRHPDHIFAMHLYIHAMEASPDPGKADAAADGLRDTFPGVGHIVHMPSHIDVRRGRWQAAVLANHKAIAADRAYASRSPEQGFYRIYMAHNRHMLLFAAMMKGEQTLALESARGMLAEIPQEWLKNDENASFVDGLFAMPAEVMMRFGRWDDLLKEPQPADRYPVARTLSLALRGVAFAAKGQVSEARAARQDYQRAVAGIPATASFGNNSAASLFAIGDDLLEGEILLREGRIDDGLAVLRKAVSKEDAMRYNEPPDWIHPVRHALGAALVRAGKHAEAEQVYREDLQRWPDNGWSLFGLATSLEAQGRHDEAATVRKAFEAVWTNDAVKLTSSCFCQVTR